MKKTRFTQEQIACALRQVEAGTPVEEITRKMGVSEASFYRRKKKFAGYGCGRASPAQAVGGRKS